MTKCKLFFKAICEDKTFRNQKIMVFETSPCKYKDLFFHVFWILVFLITRVRWSNDRFPKTQNLILCFDSCVQKHGKHSNTQNSGSVTTRASLWSEFFWRSNLKFFIFHNRENFKISMFTKRFIFKINENSMILEQISAKGKMDFWCRGVINFTNWLSHRRVLPWKPTVPR